jgi:hypothetical protein
MEIASMDDWKATYNRVRGNRLYGPEGFETCYKLDCRWSIEF